MRPGRLPGDYIQYSGQENKNKSKKRWNIVILIIVISTIASFVWLHKGYTLLHIYNKHTMSLKPTSIFTPNLPPIVIKTMAAQSLKTTGETWCAYYTCNNTSEVWVRYRVNILKKWGTLSKFTTHIVVSNSYNPPTVSILSPWGVVYSGPITTPSVLENTPFNKVLLANNGVIVLYTKSCTPCAYAVQYYCLHNNIPCAIYPANSTIYSKILQILNLHHGSYIIYTHSGKLEVYSSCVLVNISRKIENVSGKVFSSDSATLYIATGCSPCESAQKLLRRYKIHVVNILNNTHANVSFVPTLSLKIWNGYKYMHLQYVGLHSVMTEGILALKAFRFT